MEIRFNVVKDERKALVRAVSEITGQEAVYQGAPSFAFAVGAFIIDKTGTLLCDGLPEELPLLLDKLTERGFVHEELEDAPDEIPGKKTIIVDMPFFTPLALDNLRKLIAGKAALISKVIGTEDLTVAVIHDALHFHWFSPDATEEELDVYKQFVSALCLTAKKQKRVILKEKPLDENASEKFMFRCFLLKLGFIGDAYKEARKILLAGLSGNGSHKTGNGKRTAPEGVPAADSGEIPSIGAAAPDVPESADSALTGAEAAGI